MSYSNAPVNERVDSFIIPDFLDPKICPFILRVNPYYQPTARISEAWLDAHGIHSDAKHRRAFQDCDFGLLTAMCYPATDSGRFRVLCDYINCLFAFDDLTDEGGLRIDGDGTKKAWHIVMEALRDPLHYQTPFKCGKIFSSFWKRAIEAGIGAGTQRRFLEYTELYLRAVHEQVVNRKEKKILDVEEFIALRRDTGALKMCFAMGEFGLNLHLPDKVFDHSLIKVLEDCANDVVVLSNDIYSYNIEQAQGDTMNIIEAAIQQYDLDVQGAIDHAGQLVIDRIQLYLITKKALPSWGPEVDKDVKLYLSTCEDWMVAGFKWSLVSKRYFGEQVDNVRATRVVKMLPKQNPRGQALVLGL